MLTDLGQLGLRLFPLLLQACLHLLVGLHRLHSGRLRLGQFCLQTCQLGLSFFPDLGHLLGDRILGLAHSLMRLLLGTLCALPGLCSGLFQLLLGFLACLCDLRGCLLLGFLACLCDLRGCLLLGFLACLCDLRGCLLLVLCPLRLGRGFSLFSGLVHLLSGGALDLGQLFFSIELGLGLLLSGLLLGLQHGPAGLIRCSLGVLHLLLGNFRLRLSCIQGRLQCLQPLSQRRGLTACRLGFLLCTCLGRLGGFQLLASSRRFFLGCFDLSLSRGGFILGCFDLLPSCRGLFLGCFNLLTSLHSVLLGDLRQGFELLHPASQAFQLLLMRIRRGLRLSICLSSALEFSLQALHPLSKGHRLVSGSGQLPLGLLQTGPGLGQIGRGGRRARPFRGRI